MTEFGQGGQRLDINPVAVGNDLVATFTVLEGVNANVWTINGSAWYWMVA